MKYAKSNSTFINDAKLVWPSVKTTTSGTGWDGFDSYCTRLEDDGFFWDSLTVMKILAPIGPQQWGIECFTRLLQKVSAALKILYNPNCLAATESALGRLLVSRKRVEDGVKQLDQARVLFSMSSSQSVEFMGARQLLELEQGEFEAGESDLDYKTRFKCCQSLATKSHANQEYGIESTCLTKCAQIAASAKHYKELRQLRSRIENVEDTIEGEFSDPAE